MLYDLDALIADIEVLSGELDEKGRKRPRPKRHFSINKTSNKARY